MVAVLGGLTCEYSARQDLGGATANSDHSLQPGDVLRPPAAGAAAAAAAAVRRLGLVRLVLGRRAAPIPEPPRQRLVLRTSAAPSEREEPLWSHACHSRTSRTHNPAATPQPPRRPAPRPPAPHTHHSSPTLSTWAVHSNLWYILWSRSRSLALLSCCASFRTSFAAVEVYRIGRYSMMMNSVCTSVIMSIRWRVAEDTLFLLINRAPSCSIALSRALEARNYSLARAPLLRSHLLHDGRTTRTRSPSRSPKAHTHAAQSRNEMALATIPAMRATLLQARRR